MRRGGTSAAAPAMLALAGIALVSAGCESTQDKSAKIGAELGPVKKEKGLKISAESKEVEVVDTTLLTDEVGTAVAVELRNTSGQDLIDVPIAIDVLDAKGRSIYENTIPGIEPALAAMPFIGAGETAVWVNDQVLASGRPAKVDVRVGASDATYSGPQPEVSIAEPRLQGDPFTGVSAGGDVLNESGDDLARLLLYGIAREGREIVAVGRGAIEPLKANGKKAPYSVYFIGDPRRAELTLEGFPALPGQEQP